jgi:hypothetical protein
MIICELSFDRPDPKTPNYSLEEVDYYAWIPVHSDIPNHRLSLRKNLVTGAFELYRHFAQRRVLIAPEVLVVTQEPYGQDEVCFTGTFQDALDFGNREYQKWHGDERQPDKPCEHERPQMAWACPARGKK